MSYSTLPLVGSFFRPPAQLVCDSLPIGAKLFLCAEPDNQFDANAVAVWIVSEDIPASAHHKLEVELPKFGLTLDQFLAQEQWHLGYVPKNFAAQLRAQNVVPLDSILDVEFGLASNGKPQIKFHHEVL
jgi:hypothetical protein